jgi:hypothetical protein
LESSSSFSQEVKNEPAMNRRMARKKRFFFMAK